MKRLALLLILLSPPWIAVFASDAPAPQPRLVSSDAVTSPLSVDENPVAQGSFAVVKFEMGKGDDIEWEITPEPTKFKTFSDASSSYLVFSGAAGKYKVTADVINWDAKKRKKHRLTITVGDPPKPEPKPDDPTPPKPTPLESLRVIFVYESNDNLTPAQRSVVYGKAVEDWLNANCTGGKNGWRRRDKDSPSDLDPTMKSLWDQTKGHITTTPCVAIQRNDKVDILLLEATPAAMIAKLNTYKGK